MADPGPRLPGPLRTLAAAALSVALAACAASPFHRHFEAQRYHRAMDVFRADSSLHDDEEALYRVGLLYASPESPYFDPGRAQETFDRLLSRHPDGGRSREVRHIVALLEEVQNLGSRVSALRDQLQKLKAVDLEESPSDTAGSRRR